jgi:hypothetical protein
MNIKNRQQLLGILAITAVVLWVGDRLLFSPLVQSWKDRSTRIASIKKSVIDGNRLIERDAKIRERWEHMRTNTLASEQPLAEAQMYSAFNRWTEGSRIVISSVTPRWKQNADDFATYECHVEASGNLSTLTRFLYEVENDRLGIKVDLVELTAQDDRGAQLSLGLQVSGLELNPPPMP